jgi:hypothetical protein
MLLQGPSYLQGYKRQASSRVLYQLGQQLTSLGSFTFTLACRGPFPRQLFVEASVLLVMSLFYRLAMTEAGLAP